MESALLARGFHYGSAPNSVVIGWNGGHAAVTLPDGTPVSSGESGAGVRVGGGGAYQPQFNHHMYLPVQAEQKHTEPAPAETPAPPEEIPAPADAVPPADAAPADAGPEAAVEQAPVIDVAAHTPEPGEAPGPIDAPADAPAPADA